MSDNKIVMERRKVELARTGQRWLEACMFETDGTNASDSMTLETLPYRGTDLLEMVMMKQKDTSISPIIESFLDYMFENHNGIEIDKIWYEWEEIKYLFDKIWVTKKKKTIQKRYYFPEI